MPAAEIAILDTGYRILAERHEVNGESVRLYTADGGMLEVPASQVIQFEAVAQAVEPAKEISPVAEPLPASKTVSELVDDFAGLAYEMDLRGVRREMRLSAPGGP